MHYMSSDLLTKYAKVLVDYSTDVKEGDLVIIRMESILARPLAKEIYKECILKGAYPIIRLSIPEAQEYFVKYANENQLKYVDPMTEVEYEKAKVFISIGAPENVKHMAKADSKKMAERSKATRFLSEKLLTRSANGDLNWVIADFPTEALAQEAKMSLEEYTEFLIKGCYLNEENPVQRWMDIGVEQQRIADYLNKTTKIRYKGEKTDITFSTEGRTWISCSGKNNFPDGEIFTSPVENSANGEIYFDYPAIYRGNESNKIYLKLENGKVVYAKAEQGDEFFQNMINLDEGAKFVGEIAIGTNDMIQDITGNILFDEKIGGAIHMALGASYPETGGKNVSGLHWDLIKNMKNGGEIYADDKLIYQNGKFII